MLALLDVVTGWLLFSSLATSLGVVVGRWVVLPHDDVSGAVTSRALRTTAARLGRCSASILFVSLGLVFLRQLLEFHDPFAPWSEDIGVLLRGTTWGAAWMAAIAASLVMAGAFRLASRDRLTGWLPATVAACALGAFPALTGHANSGDLRGLTLAADILHVWSVGGWIGGLVLILFLERRLGHGRGEGSESLLPVLVPRFSSVALVCVAILLATGVFSAWIHLGSLGALPGTRYGRLLLLKIALVLGVLAVGALNWRRLTPRLGGSGGREALRRAATIELVVANVVLAVTTLLVRTPPH